MREKIAIVGATGYFGRYITTLFQKNHCPIIACSQHGGKICGINIDPVDISKREDLEHWVNNQEISTMIYLSSIVPKSLIDSNVQIFNKNLKMHLNILKLWKQQQFHLIYASSCSVYGPYSPLPWTEKNVTFPDNYYSISKMVGELLFYKEYLNLHKELTILRINAPYSFDPNRKTVINIFIENALVGKDIVLYGSGNRAQDYIYIKDIAQAFWLAYKMKALGIFNIASGQTISMKELAEKIISLTGSTSKITYSGSFDPLENERVFIDVMKSRNFLGFSPKYLLTDGLMDCIKKYKSR